MNNSSMLTTITGWLRHHKLIVGLLLIVLVAYVFSQFSLLQVTVSGEVSSSQKLTYQISNQASPGTKSFTSTSKSVTRVVRRGTYEVTVTQADHNALVIGQTKGLFQKTNITANLKPEQKRRFVGDNPDACMYYQRVLLSFACNGSTSTASLHMPATEKKPTSVQKAPLPLEGTMQGTIETTKGIVVLLRATFDEINSGHVFYLLNSKREIVARAEATILDANKLYSIETYQGGFVVYDHQLSSIYRFSAFDSPAQEIKLPDVKNRELIPINLEVSSSGSVAVLFSNIQSDADEAPTKNILNSLAVLTDKWSPLIELNKKDFGQFSFCTNDHLCILNSTDLEVYRFRDNNLDYQFRLTNTQSVERLGEQVLVGRGHGIVKLDVISRSATIAYSFDGYSPCGLHQAGTGYLLCVYDRKKERRALLIEDKPNTDSIDKKVAALMSLPQIRTLSVYDNLIFISPDLGQLVESPGGGFGYDKDRTSAAKSQINQKIDELQINRSVYKIIIPLLD